MRTLLALLLISLLAATRTPLAAQEDDAGAQVVLRPGDSVKISVWRKPELSGEFLVSADGSVADPFYAPVKVAGVPFAVAVERIREFVSRTETSPQIWVEPRMRVLIGGEVRTPSLYAFGRETTVVEALALAGGATERGAPAQARLIRDGREHTLDLTDPSGEPARMPIRSGDRLLVPRRYGLFRDFVLPAATVVGGAGSLVSLLNLVLR